MGGNKHMENLVRRKIEDGQEVLGAFLWTYSEPVVECLSYTGLDYVIIDCEHTPVEADGAVSLIRAAECRGLTPFVRAKELGRSAILKLLDGGAMGVIVPNIKTVDEVKKIAAYGKYPPVGERGFVQSREAGFGQEPYAADIVEYMAVSNRETLLLPQCETEELLNVIEQAVQVDGIDGFFVGPYDLSLSMGIPGQFQHPRFRVALQRIAEACHAAGKYAFIFCSTQEAMEEQRRMGYIGLTLGTDTSVLIEGYRTRVTAARASREK